ncbi:hypothetical protein IB695_04809 [Escherichia coli]|nr:hypothetical protein CHC58_24730 [Salmonella enterica]MBL0859707.1 hypothetical protein [Escherichia coli]QHI55832.1 hypothetical protein GUJ28_25230 [Escherichia coli]UMW91780.1 Death on curing protein, Doc toxin [Escherichia coli]
MPAFEWVHVQLHQQKGMISLSPPTICNSAGKIPGTRELIPHESYRLVYQIDGETVWILTLVHTARLWPPVRD